MDNLFVGNVVPPPPVEPHCRRCCPASFALSHTLWHRPYGTGPCANLSEMIPVRVPDHPAKSDRLEIGIGDRPHPGIVTGIISEW
jgi:hypothetical protein